MIQPRAGKVGDLGGDRSFSVEQSHYDVSILDSKRVLPILTLLLRSRGPLRKVAGLIWGLLDL